MKKTRNAPPVPAPDVQPPPPPAKGGRKLHVQIADGLRIAERGAKFLGDVAALGTNGATPAEIDAAIRDGEALIASIRAAFHKV